MMLTPLEASGTVSCVQPLHAIFYDVSNFLNLNLPFILILAHHQYKQYYKTPAVFWPASGPSEHVLVS